MELIQKIQKASKIEDLLSVVNFKTEFNAILKEIHPDVCKEPGASEASAKMNQWKDCYENGKPFKDDVGIFKTNGYWVEFESNEKALDWSFENYDLFKRLSDDTSTHFHKYLPFKAEPNAYLFHFAKRAIPLSGIKLPQEHVNWVLNRLLEYCAYLSEQGFAHCGLNPESVFIVPETHGIQICSFYHLTRFGNQIKTVSGKYQGWYPAETFKSKTANPSIDIELSKKISLYLLGQPSGSAIGLRKTHNEDFINFIVNQHDNAYKAKIEYTALLRKNFKTEFHNLTI